MRMSLKESLLIEFFELLWASAEWEA